MKKVYKKSIPLLLIGLIIGAMAYTTSGYMSLVLRDIIDGANELNREIFLIHAKKLLILSLILIIFNTVLSYVKGKYRKKANIDLKSHYLSKIFEKDIDSFHKDNNSKYISNLTNDLNTLDVNFIDGIFEIALAFISFIVVVVIISYINIRILFAIILTTSLILLISNLMSKSLKKLYGERISIYGSYTSYINEVLSAFRIIKSNNLEEKIENDFSKKSKNLQNKTYEIEKRSTFIFAFQNFTINAIVMSILIVTIYYNIIGKLTMGNIVVVIINFSTLIGPFKRASELLPKIVSSNEIFKSLDDSISNDKNLDEIIEITEFKDCLELKDVSFAYDNSDEVFKNVNVKFEKNKKYLIIGPSGAGKSTFLKILRKYFSPIKGKVLLDGNDLSKISKKSYFSIISNVEQKVFVFDDTLRNNITLYKDVNDYDLNISIKKAGLDSFLNTLPNGLDTVIKNNGENISGGERSRIAIARALINKADILYLDEAFQSLDYEIAQTIEETILNINNLTVINVSHIVIDENKDKYDEVIYIGNKSIEFE